MGSGIDLAKLNNSPLVHTPMNNKDPLDHFLQRVQMQEKIKNQQTQHSDGVAVEKSKQLIPIRKLLKNIQDMELHVYHADKYSDRNGNFPAQKFEVFENESSPSFLPGPSLYFNHPAAVEIAIPNEWDTGHPGVVSICCTTYHPESLLLRGPFRNFDDACIALAEFLARSTVSISSYPAKR